MASLQSGAAAEAATAKANDGGEYNHLVMGKKRNWGFVLLRLVASFATASATLVMALNKETKSIVVATIGTDPLTANLSAHFYHTPAFM